MLDKIQTHICGNGLKVICCKKSDAPVISIQVWYRTGSSRETDEIRGISHILEHMMFRGSEHIASEEHSRKIADVGGHCNAFTAEDITAFVNSVPAGHLAMVLTLEADRMASLSLSPATLDTERTVIIEEFHNYMNNPVTKAFLEFRRSLFAGHPYELSPLGLLDTIGKISADQCREYHQAWYGPENATVVVVGDVGSEAEVFESVEATLGKISRRTVSTVDITSFDPATIHAKRSTVRIDFDVPLLVVGFPAPASAHPDALALEMAQMIIGQGETSRLYKRLVRKTQLCVMAGGMNHFLRKAGMSLFFGVFTPDVPVERIEKALAEEIKAIQQNGVDAAEIAKIKNAMLSSRVFEGYSAEQISQRIGFSELVEGDWQIWARRLDALENLTHDQLRAAVTQWWDESRRQTLVMRPRKVSPLLYGVGLARRIFTRGAS